MFGCVSYWTEARGCRTNAGARSAFSKTRDLYVYKHLSLSLSL